ncbi:gustatory receptor for sugar taste 64f [Leptinotarsa decemlineata]|uniref:gustatory receptor for sugar taste 64f n=1 Tax=Leptinotarsa decemlineata TaxID=7539 RepID=UPI003D307CB1
MCIILTFRFEQLKDKIVCYVKSINLCGRRDIVNLCHNQTEKIDVLFWKNIREDYNGLCQMCSTTNDLLGDMILLSYTCNIIFILVQLFVSLRDRDGTVETIYFFSSFGFVVARTVIVSIYGGWLNETAKSALPTLNAVPTEIYNPEIACLINQIHTSSPTMTGHDFFSITKGLILSIAATIITYELALIQFNQVALKKFSSNNDTVCY